MNPTRALEGEGRVHFEFDPASAMLALGDWLSQVAATARTMEQAQTLCALVTRQMTPHLLGDPARVQSVTEVQPDAPEGGAVRITAGR